MRFRFISASGKTYEMRVAVKQRSDEQSGILSKEMNCSPTLDLYGSLTFNQHRSCFFLSQPLFQVFPLIVRPEIYIVILTFSSVSC